MKHLLSPVRLVSAIVFLTRPRPDRIEHDRPRPNRSSRHRMRLDSSNTFQSQPPSTALPPENTGFPPHSPVQKKIRQPPSTHGPTSCPRRRSNHALAVRPDRTLPNTAERLRTDSPVKTCAQTDKSCPKLSKIDHPHSPIPCKTLEILPGRPRGKNSLAKHPKSEQSSATEHRRPDRAWRRILRSREATRSGTNDHHQ